jgi:hypothetical protein
MKNSKAFRHPQIRGGMERLWVGDPLKISAAQESLSMIESGIFKKTGLSRDQSITASNSVWRIRGCFYV